MLISLPAYAVLNTESIILEANKYELYSNCFVSVLKLFTFMPADGSYQRLLMISYLDEEILVSTFLIGSQLPIICFIDHV